MLNILQTDLKAGNIKMNTSIIQTFNNDGGDNREYIDSIVSKETPSIIDYEKEKFDYIDKGASQIRLQLYNQNGAVLYHSDLGFTDEDLQFGRAGYKESFLLLSFYDNDKIGEQNLLFTQKFRMQTNVSSLSGTAILPASSMPVVFILKKPPQVQYVSENYYLYWYKLNTFNKPLYAEAVFYNAKTGKSTPLIAYNSPVDIKTIKDYKYINYTLVSINGQSVYAIDFSNRTISNVLSILKINLYQYSL